ncbi:MAG: glycogen/starch synthase [Deltaproteobacteria bacterium]|nr:glycogen/starch synthase [Deltaproteobacteria bacterium]
MLNLSAPNRILIVTTDVIYIPNEMGESAEFISAQPGGFAGFLPDLIDNLLDQGIDVHLAQPDYRRRFGSLLQKEQSMGNRKIPAHRVHLAKDRVFFYQSSIDSNYEWKNIEISLAFQREVANNIIPWVQPDLIHCYDWMTGLIPAMAKELGIPCLFTINNIYSVKSFLSHVEDMGIDAAAFWQNLFYDHFPTNYEETRHANPFDLLLSGVFAANFVNTVSSTSLMDIAQGQNVFFEASLRQLLSQKGNAGYAAEFNHRITAQHYMFLYNKLLRQQLFTLENFKGDMAGKTKFFWNTGYGTGARTCAVRAGR